MREYLLGSIMLFLLYFLVTDHIKLAKENDLSQRELRGVLMEINDGRYTRTIIKTKEVRVPTEITKNVYVPTEGYVTITPKDPTKRLEDVVNISYKTSGTTLGLGLETSVLPRGFGVDAKFLFASRWGVGLGLNYFNSERDGDFFSPTGHISYRLDQIKYIHNTELLFGLGVLPRNFGYLGLRMGL